MTDTDDIPREAFDLITQIMQSNSDHLVGLYRDLLVAEKAKLDMTRDLLARALNNAEWGGTTAQYEETLAKCRLALYPPYGVEDKYRERARKYVNGEPGWDAPIIDTQRPGGEV